MGRKLPGCTADHCTVVPEGIHNTLGWVRRGDEEGEWIGDKRMPEGREEAAGPDKVIKRLQDM